MTRQNGVSSEGSEACEKDERSTAIARLKHWRPEANELRRYVRKHRREEAMRIDFERLGNDAASAAIEHIEPAILEGRFRSLSDARARMEYYLFGTNGGRFLGSSEVLRLVDSGKYAILSRRAVENRLDQAIEAGDRLQFELACKDMFAWAVTFTRRHGLGIDGEGAEQAARSAWVPVVMGFVNLLRSYVDNQGQLGDLPASAFTGKGIIGRLVQRLLGFRRNGRRIPGEISKYIANRYRRTVLSIDAPLSRLYAEDCQITLSATIADYRLTPEEVVTQADDEDALLRQLHEQVLGVPDADTRELLVAIIGYIQMCRQTLGPGPVPLYWQKRALDIPLSVVCELQPFLALKSSKAVMNRLVEVWSLLRRADVLCVTVTPSELLMRVEKLRQLGQQELAPDTGRTCRATLDALCRWITSKANAALQSNADQLTLPPLLCFRYSRRFLDAQLSTYLTNVVRVSHDVLRRRLNKALSQLDEWRVVKLHREANLNERSADE